MTTRPSTEGDTSPFADKCPDCWGWGEVRDADGAVVACPTCYPDAYGIDMDAAS